MARHVLTALICVLFVIPQANGQVSGGLEGKWHLYEVFVEGCDDTLESSLDVWVNGDFVAWRVRVALDVADLERPLVWRHAETVATLPDDARLSTSVDRPAHKPTASGLTHLIIESGVATGLLQLRLEPNCVKACEVDGFDVVQFGGLPLALHRPGQAAPRMPVARAFPIEPGDIQRTWSDRPE